MKKRVLMGFLLLVVCMTQFSAMAAEADITKQAHCLVEAQVGKAGLLGVEHHLPQRRVDDGISGKIQAVPGLETEIWVTTEECEKAQRPAIASAPAANRSAAVGSGMADPGPCRTLR